jgi:hypothetical protein
MLHSPTGVAKTMRISSFLAILWLMPLTVEAASDTYESATIDASGQLRIMTTDHREVVIPVGQDQTSFAQPVISKDRRAVGATASYPHCCTSYDIPLQLVIYADGVTHRFRSKDGLPIFQWGFVDSGRVAFGAEPVHFGCFVHYELRDIKSERLIDSANVPEPCGQNPDPKPTTIPKWIGALATPAAK